jgi:hypothetical protein
MSVHDLTDLAEAETPAAFMDALRDYHALRGKPGSRLMAIRAGQRYTATPIREALAADILPKPEMLRAILDGLHATPADRAAFTQAWYRLAGFPATAELAGRLTP